MVQVSTAFLDEDQPSFHRFSTRGNGYILGHERGLSTTQLPLSYREGREHGTLANGNGGGDQSSRQDFSTRTRSRIPVACQRCRKRKIRCSGDNGGACLNCTNASCPEQCLFLRVASQDVSLKVDSAVSDYLDSAARSQYRLVSQPNSLVQTTSPVEYDQYQFRSNPIPPFQQYNNKIYNSGSPYTDFDGTVDYGLQSSTYQVIAHDHFRTPSPSSGYHQGRDWETASQLPRSSTVFIDQDQPLYHNSQLPFNPQTNLSLSTSSNHFEAKNTNGSGIINLPSPVTSEANDRPVLPNPTANRPAPINAFLRNNDSFFSSSQVPNYKSHQNNNHLNTITPQPFKTNSQSIAPGKSSYNIPITTTNIDPLNYDDNHGDMLTRHDQDVSYSSHENMHYQHSPSTHDSCRHGSTSSSSTNRSSECRQSPSKDGSLPINEDGEFSNHHHYVPYRYELSDYTAHPLGMPPQTSIRRLPRIQSLQ